ncbi:unnamed protein product [Cuscuta epithymum]|uniref:HXXXD-type acyl-transferase family protein n=1 Tax=Cuscuta epithymum TaxID=186058 RepID=A0AAV0FJ94_9ASTE|nr:unnamed protein product [Cuscuta epithymum]
MAEVEIVSTCLIGAACAPPAERSRIELTPWDLQLLLIGTIQKGLLFPKPTIQQEQNLFIHSTLIDRLKTSLSATLDFFPPLAGRFATDEEDEKNNTSTVFVDCNNAGVEFVEAKAAGVTVAAILDPSNDAAAKTIRSFFPLNGIRNLDGISKPLLGVQVTELLDGYFIGCTLNHGLGDGASFWNFFRSWAELSRGCPQISEPPILDRWFPESTTRPVRLPMALNKERLSLGGLKTPPAYPERVFRLTRETIAKLKEKANSELGIENNNSVSSLQAYMAHIWLSVTRARELDGSEDVQISITIGTRSRVPLPKGYWGNALYVKMVTAKAGELLEKGLGWAALKLKETVEKQGREEVMNGYLSWVRSPAFLGEKKLFLTSNTLVIGSSPRFDMYGTDFGWGKPVAVRSGMANKSDGKVTLFAGPEEGSVDIELCILPKTLMGLCNDPEFLEYVTIPGI